MIDNIASNGKLYNGGGSLEDSFQSKSNLEFKNQSNNGAVPFAHARRKKQINGKLLECNERTCFNGGRCLPSSPGYK